MKRSLLALLLLTCMTLPAQVVQLSDSALISLMTCTPGDEVYSKYGHSAVRVFDPLNKIDVTFNYGIFNFHTEHFYAKFVKGETWYQLGIQTTHNFLIDSEETGRDTYEQVLNLSQKEKQSLFNALEQNSRPENKYYLYNFVFDNCATRPFLLLKNSINERLNAPLFDMRRDTYRDMITYYSEKNSWAGFGINLAFGKDADVIMTPEQRLFLPEQLMDFVSEAKKQDGEPLCLNSDARPFEVKENRGLTSPTMAVMLILLIITLVTAYDMRKSRKCSEMKVSWWLDELLFFVGFLVGSILFYLTFFSIHPLVGRNWNLILLSPLLILPFVMVLVRKSREWLKRYLGVLGICLVLLFVVRCLCGQHQHLLMIVPAVHGIRLACLAMPKYRRIKVKSRRGNK